MARLSCTRAVAHQRRFPGRPALQDRQKAETQAQADGVPMMRSIVTVVSTVSRRACALALPIQLAARDGPGSSL